MRHGPHVVHDLYDVIHHSGALDTDDLIAMQEGRDVLAKAFAPSSPKR